MSETANSPEYFDGGCTCTFVRYRMTDTPMFVNCCHCRWCQRETGTAFALSALIESERLRLISGDIQIIDIPSNSGKGQRVSRCPKCLIAVWSVYGAGDAIRFVRVGTLDEPDAHPPGIHIFTASKQPWLPLPVSVPAVPGYYRAADHWPAASLERFKAATARA